MEKRLLQTIVKLTSAESWDECRRIAEEHPELLTDAAEAVLRELASAQDDEWVGRSRYAEEERTPATRFIV